MYSAKSVVFGVAFLFVLGISENSLAKNRNENQHGGDVSSQGRAIGTMEMEWYDKLINAVEKLENKEDKNKGDNSAGSEKEKSDSQGLVHAAQFAKDYRTWLRDCALNDGDSSAKEFSPVLDGLVAQMVGDIDKKQNDESPDLNPIKGLINEVARYLKKKKKKDLFLEDIDRFGEVDEKLFAGIKLLVKKIFGVDDIDKDITSSEVNSTAAIQELEKLKKDEMKVCDLRSKQDRKQAERPIDEKALAKDSEPKEEEKKSDLKALEEKLPSKDVESSLAAAPPFIPEKPEEKDEVMPTMPNFPPPAEEKKEEEKEPLSLDIPEIPKPTPTPGGGSEDKAKSPMMMGDPGGKEGGKKLPPPQKPKEDKPKPPKKDDKKDDKKKPEKPKEEKKKDKPMPPPQGQNGPMMLPPMPSSSDSQIPMAKEEKNLFADDAGRSSSRYSDSGSGDRDSSSTSGILNMLRYSSPFMNYGGFAGGASPVMMQRPPAPRPVVNRPAPAVPRR